MRNEEHLQNFGGGESLGTNNSNGALSSFSWWTENVQEIQVYPWRDLYTGLTKEGRSVLSVGGIIP